MRLPRGRSRRHLISRSFACANRTWGRVKPRSPDPPGNAALGIVIDGFYMTLASA
jgi:hypothetical protein